MIRSPNGMLTTSTVLSALLFALGGAVGCGDGGDGGGSGGSGSGGSGSGGSGSGGSGSGEQTTSTGSGGSGGESTSTGSGGSGGESTSTGTGGSGGAYVLSCPDERAVALGPIDEVSEGVVTVLDEAMGEVFVDASAGGVMAQKDNPWIYVALGTRSRVDVTDLSADESTGWDLAIKRPLLRVNSGDGGPAGGGGAVHLDAEFDDVTASDAEGITFAEEDWFDDECVLQTDAAGAIKTSFDGWYVYEDMTLSPAAGTWLVRGADGASIFKVAILSYYANPDGTPGMAGGKYLLRVGELSP